MPQAKNVNNIVIHCSAGFAKVPAIVNYWKNTLKWKNPYGYHWIIDTDGTIYWLDKNGNYTTDESKIDFTKITNGVLGHNSNIINGSYIGGVENIGTNSKPIWKAKDTRTEQQIKSMDCCLQKTLKWLSENGKDITSNLGVVGHFDFSPDKNGTGIIEPFERIKECPSFSVLGSDIHLLYSSPDRYNKLPITK